MHLANLESDTYMTKIIENLKCFKKVSKNIQKHNLYLTI